MADNPPPNPLISQFSWRSSVAFTTRDWLFDHMGKVEFLLMSVTSNLRFLKTWAVIPQPSFHDDPLIYTQSYPYCLHLQVMPVDLGADRPTPALGRHLYAGGRGTIQLGSFFGIPSIYKYKASFLVRTRVQFAEGGYIVVLPDIPSDQDRLRYSYRLGYDQITDATAIVDHFKSTYQLPVWLLGTSASNLGVAHAAANLSDKIAGIALTASVTRVTEHYGVYGEFPQGTASTDLSAVTVPVVIASNREDACELSPSQDLELIRERLTNSPRVEVKYFSGGFPPRSKPCNALSRHGFLGIEEEVVGQILSFIQGRVQ